MYSTESTLNDAEPFACTCTNECKHTQCNGQRTVAACKAMSCTALQIAWLLQVRRKSLSGRRCWGLSKKRLKPCEPLGSLTKKVHQQLQFENMRRRLYRYGGVAIWFGFNGIWCLVSAQLYAGLVFITGLQGCESQISYSVILRVLIT